MFRSALAAAPWADRERCAMVGDMPSDIAPARELGMHAVMLGVDAASLADAVDGLLSAGDGQ
jgi:FMN phosphatase YigB (HAD superfamily)